MAHQWVLPVKIAPLNLQRVAMFTGLLLMGGVLVVAFDAYLSPEMLLEMATLVLCL